MNSYPAMIMRATQKKMMSGPVTRSVVGQNFLSVSVCSGQPMVAKGQSQELNQVSSTSVDWENPKLSNSLAISEDSEPRQTSIRAISPNKGREFKVERSVTFPFVRVRRQLTS